MVVFEDFASRKYLDYGKVYLVLYYKGFSWKKELENEFNISSNVVSKAISILEREGFVISKDFWSIDLDMQDAIRRLNAGYFSQIKRSPKIFILSEEGKEEGGYVILDKLLELAKKVSSLQATLGLIKEKANAYKKLKKRFEFEENSRFFRVRKDYQSSLVYETPTLRYKRLRESLVKGILEFREELGSDYLVKYNKSKSVGVYVGDGVKDENERRKNELISLSSGSKELLSSFNFCSDLFLNSDVQSINCVYYNGKKISSEELERVLNDKKNYDRSIKNAVLKVGVSEDKVERYVGKRVNFVMTKILGFNLNEDLRLADESSYSSFFESIISKIKERGWMDSFMVERLCKSSENFEKFIEFAEKRGIFWDGSDFRVIK